MSAVDIPGSGDQSQNQRPLWEVTRVEDTLALTGPGLTQRVKRVYFTLWDGSESYVDVPLSQFNDQRVAELVNEHATQLRSVVGIMAPQ